MFSQVRYMWQPCLLHQTVPSFEIIICLEITVFWDVTSCSLIDIYRSFGRTHRVPPTYRPTSSRLHGVTSVTALRISNLTRRISPMSILNTILLSAYQCSRLQLSRGFPTQNTLIIYLTLWLYSKPISMIGQSYNSRNALCNILYLSVSIFQLLPRNNSPWNEGKWNFALPINFTEILLKKY
jgi:hypothetical protein